MFTFTCVCIKLTSKERACTHTQKKLITLTGSGEEKTEKLGNGVHIFNIETDISPIKNR